MVLHLAGVGRRRAVRPDNAATQAQETPVQIARLLQEGGERFDGLVQYGVVLKYEDLIQAARLSDGDDLRVRHLAADVTIFGADAVDELVRDARKSLGEGRAARWHVGEADDEDGVEIFI